MKIETAKIKNLYNEWNLDCTFDSRVNILSGINGSFKSTLLKLIRDLLISRSRNKAQISEAEIKCNANIKLFYKHFEDSLLALKKEKVDELLLELASRIQADWKDVDEKTLSNRILKADIVAFKKDGKRMPLKEFEKICKVDFISTFDMPQANENDKVDNSYLDDQLKKLESDYAYYLSDLAKNVTEKIISDGNIAKNMFDDIYKQNNLFINIINSAYAETGKVIDTSQSKLNFKVEGLNLSSKDLSSGEKQLLIIMLTVLLEREEEYILLMDEPEISMHFEWQCRLIENILSLNPNCQIILTSHSPALIMNGWEQYVLDMNRIRTKIS